MQLDLLLLKSHEDSHYAYLSFQGRQDFNVTLITRIRNCSIGLSLGNECTTIAMDDYRYESVMLTSDAIEWYSTVASLRIAGQA